MNKQEIIKIIEKYKLDKSQFVVISGAALVLLGIENKARDIDICCTEYYYNYLIQNYNCVFERVNEYGKNAYLIDNIINFGLSLMPKNIEIIDGIQCASLIDILELKKFLKRDKDKELIKKLELIIQNK